ncbi:hypothetical protein PAG57_24520 [Klebsiella quasipneumoniae]|uniref:hypothetical protein n=1 Tax=Klebsiella pneumoniae complex TaxID=3390273 RepID=UPI002174E266|nr:MULTISPECIES: hypothetical protein [Klebsiella]MDR4549830.1 hypothetical protein [Klebsiella quasipneumoniae]
MNNINLIRSETTKGIHVIKGKALIDDILSYSILHLSRHIQLCHEFFLKKHSLVFINTPKEGANKQVISSQADSLIKISRIWADFFPANTSNQPI